MIDFQIHHFDRLPSTNRWCHDTLDHLDDGAVIICEEQTEGRGRGQKSWFSPRDRNLYCSIVIKDPKILATNPMILMHASGLALRAAIQVHGVKKAWLKWPNDIHVGNEKLAGILCESRTIGNKITSVIIGFGVNLNTSKTVLKSHVDIPATSLKVLTGRIIDRDPFLSAVLGELQQYLELALATPEKLLAEWKAASGLIGKCVTLKNETTHISGEVADFGRDGSLMLRDPSGLNHTFYNGEISLYIDNKNA